MTETKKNPIGRFIENTLVPISTAFAQNRYVRCIGTGSQNLMAIIMIGAVFNLLNSIQIAPYQSFIQATGIAAFLNAVYNACMNFMGVFMVFSVGYAGAKIFDHDELAFNNGLMSLVAYLIMVPVATNEAGSSVVVLDYLGSHGVFLAFILGIMATKINIALVERNITIKMPAGVPENVTQCFTSIIPGAAIALVSSLLRGLFTLTPWGNVIDAVYALLQTPLANITGSLGGFIILLLLAQILWFFGVHGSYTVLAILYPLWFLHVRLRLQRRLRLHPGPGDRHVPVCQVQALQGIFQDRPALRHLQYQRAPGLRHAPDAELHHADPLHRDPHPLPDLRLGRYHSGPDALPHRPDRHEHHAHLHLRRDPGLLEDRRLSDSDDYHERRHLVPLLQGC